MLTITSDLSKRSVSRLSRSKNSIVTRARLCRLPRFLVGSGAVSSNWISFSASSSRLGRIVRPTMRPLVFCCQKPTPPVYAPVNGIEFLPSSLSRCSREDGTPPISQKHLAPPEPCPDDIFGGATSAYVSVVCQCRNHQCLIREFSRCRPPVDFINLTK